jgi:hypothetical protein
MRNLCVRRVHQNFHRQKTTFQLVAKSHIFSPILIANTCNEGCRRGRSAVCLTSVFLFEPDGVAHAASGLRRIVLFAFQRGNRAFIFR